MFVQIVQLVSYLVVISVNKVEGICGDTVRWSHRVNIDDVFGVWYGVGYAQHNPDMTNKPNEVGCVSLYITDATNEFEDNWLDWSFQRRNFSDQNWRSSKSNPWSGDKLAGSWLDIRLKRRAKRDSLDEKRIRVLWDEDGHSLEQIYLYYPEEPGLWTAERLLPGERQLMSRGIGTIIVL
ncbi:unnamed protein product [Danaus chrysippus]|uniref:(African queen) hypothetical protein n=1 Tax=Danaus chrysippus TaxID=151541 RepID=A0A8J2R0V5_9NEOP|nr:unnamed protein product [Danaus chrysippus]